MAAIEIRIPQLGEGLQEARIVRFLKQPGDSVHRDEPIFEMETDKAVMEIESPAAGILGAWDAKEDQVLPIGAVIGRIDTDGAAVSASATSEPVQTAVTETYAADHATATAPSPEIAPIAESTEGKTPNPPAPPGQILKNQFVAPRTKAYAREKGISDEELVRLARKS